MSADVIAQDVKRVGRSRLKRVPELSVQLRLWIVSWHRDEGGWHTDVCRDEGFGMGVKMEDTVGGAHGGGCRFLRLLKPQQP